MSEATKRQILFNLQSTLDMSESDISDLFKISLPYFQEIGYKVLSFESPIEENKPVYMDFALQKDNKIFIGEIKNYPPDTEERKKQYLQEIKYYMSKLGKNVGGGILVTPSFVPQETKDFYERNNIQIWDIDTINQFKKATEKEIASA